MSKRLTAANIYTKRNPGGTARFSFIAGWDAAMESLSSAQSKGEDVRDLIRELRENTENQLLVDRLCRAIRQEKAAEHLAALRKEHEPTVEKLADELEFEMADTLQQALDDGRLNPDSFVADNRDILKLIARGAAIKFAALAGEGVREAFTILESAPELNPSNYDHEQVCELNEKATEAYMALRSISQERETCGDCMGSGYSGHPDSGQTCYRCDGSGGVPTEDLSAMLERDRSKVAEGVNNIRDAIRKRQWLTEPGRGPYAWDDDGYKKEFGDAISEIFKAMEPLQKIASDWTGCPTDPHEIAAARGEAFDAPSVESLDSLVAMIWFQYGDKTAAKATIRKAMEDSEAPLRTALQDMVTVAEFAEWDKSRTGRDIVLRNAKTVLTGDT